MRAVGSEEFHPMISPRKSFASFPAPAVSFASVCITVMDSSLRSRKEKGHVELIVIMCCLNEKAVSDGRDAL